MLHNSLMDTENDLSLDAHSVLDRDNIPNENQSVTCFACDEPVVGLYCAECGQKNDNYRRSIFSLGWELFASLTALEGRTWRSLRSLILKPGQMAREYADGARQKWTSPVRIYLAMSLILFGYITLSGTQLIAFGPKKTAAETLQLETGNEAFTPAIYFFKRKGELSELVTDEALSAFEDGLNQIMSSDSEKSVEELKAEIESNNKNIARMQKQMESMTYGKQGVQTGVNALQARNEAIEKLIEKKLDPDAASAEIPTQPDPDAEDIEPPETPETNEDSDSNSNIKITGLDGKTYSLSNEEIRLIAIAALRQPERLNAAIGRWLPRIMFLMMPFSMLMGAIFIRGKETAMLYDHLVHAAYIHAFSFLLLFIFILLVQFTQFPNLLIIYTLILLIYLPISAKRMFKRGWFKSFLTSYGVGSVYTFIMSLILVYLISLGALDIAAEYAVTQS